MNKKNKKPEQASKADQGQQEQNPFPGLKPAPDNALAYGEVTGHAHRVTSKVYVDGNGARAFAGPTTVTHEEHKPIQIPPGKYTTGQVKELDHLTGMEAAVRD